MKASAPSFDDCLSAAESHAERYFGKGPVPHWRPSFRPARWIAGTAFVAAAVTALALAWNWSISPATDAPEAAVLASAAAQMSPTSTAALAADAASVATEPRSLTGCGDSACVAETTARAPQAVPTLPGADAPAWPTDLDAWALDPQPIGAPPALAPATRPRLHNTPVVPDESDPTPASDGQPDEDEGGDPAV